MASSLDGMSFALDTPITISSGAGTNDLCPPPLSMRPILSACDAAVTITPVTGQRDAGEGRIRKRTRQDSGSLRSRQMTLQSGMQKGRVSPQGSCAKLSCMIVPSKSLYLISMYLLFLFLHSLCVYAAHLHTQTCIKHIILRAWGRGAAKM